jgi:hypothetical protein
MSKNPMKSTRISERRNPASNHENFTEMILDMVNQNVQETLKKF